MLITGGILQCNSLSQNLTSHFLLHPNKTQINFFSNPLTQPKLFAFHGGIPTGFCLFASKSSRKGGIISPLQMEEFDDELEMEEFEEAEMEDEDMEDEEVIIPLRNMKKWLENKPSGFGEGKVYDTSIEDKLFEEMEQSRLAQLANINKLKNSPEETNFKKGKLQKQKVSDAAPNGIRVRLVNLPKKKNIHRDLQAAFKGVPGIINISPAVSGNKKTREPVCKGFGFVDFKSEDQANSFVHTFSGQSIAFGKIEKQISCEIMNPSPSNPAYEQPLGRTLEGNLNPDSETPNSSVDSWEDTDFDQYKSAEEDHVSALGEDNEETAEDHVSMLGEDDEESFKTFSSSTPHGGEETERENESTIISKSSKNRTKVREKGEKIMAKRKVGKKPKLNIPGSANRLKIKDKSLLTGVFSKYGAEAVLATKGES